MSIMGIEILGWVYEKMDGGILMRLLIGDIIYEVKDAQFMEEYLCLYPVDTPFLYKIPYDNIHTKDFMKKELLEKGYLSIDWIEDVEKDYF